MRKAFTICGMFAAICCMLIATSSIGAMPETAPLLRASAPRVEHSMQLLKSSDQYNAAYWSHVFGLRESESRRSVDQGGDNIANATPIPALPYNDGGTTLDAIDDYDAPCPASTAPDVVYVYVPPIPQLVTVSLCGSFYDTKLFVFENAPGNLVGCNDDACGLSSQITGIVMNPGIPYFIIIDGFGSSAGDYVLSVTEETPCVVDCQPTDLPECPEFPGPAHAANDCDGGCNNDDAGGVNLFGNVVPGQSVCGVGFTYIGPGGGNHRDTDWYLFDVIQTEIVEMTLEAEFDVLFGIVQINDCVSPAFVSFGVQPPCSPHTVITEPLPPGQYAMFVAPSGFTGVPYPLNYRAMLSVQQPPEPCLEALWEDQFKLGPAFVGETGTTSVQVLNISDQPLNVTAQADAPFLTLPDPGPHLVPPGGILNLPVEFTPPAPGWVDCAISFFHPGCEPFIGQLTVFGELPPTIPGPPVLTGGMGCGRVALQVDQNGNNTLVNYEIAASTDNWATTEWVQLDGTLGPVPVAAGLGTWNNLLAEDLSGLLPGEVLHVKVRAMRGSLITPFGPETVFPVPECPMLGAPLGLVIQRDGSDIVLDWDLVEFDVDGIFPVVDAQYIVASADYPGGLFTDVMTVSAPHAVLAGEVDANAIKHYQVRAVSELGPLMPSLRLTQPNPGDILTGAFIMAARDAGGGAFLPGVSAAFECQIGGVWTPVAELQTPQWLEGSGIWSAMVDAAGIPSGPCSVRVVESGPFGTRIAGHEVRINRVPRAHVLSTHVPEIVTMDGTPSTDPDGAITYYVWTLPDGTHRYGPAISIPTAPEDSAVVTLEVNDDVGVTGSELESYVCNTTGVCQGIGQRCGCKSMEINDSGKIKGKNKKFPPGHVKDDGNAATADDDQNLGEIHRNTPNPPGDADRAHASFNFEVRALLKYEAGNPSQDCEHYQKFQLDEKCNGAQINTNDWYGQPDWDDHPVGGGTWASDNYDDESRDNTIQQHDRGAAPEVDWLDGPSRGITGKKLKDCAPGSLTYDCVFCAVVDGPLGCCRCRFRVTWTMSSNGQITAGPSLDKTNDPGDPNDDNLGCMTGAAGGCGC